MTRKFSSEALVPSHLLVNKHQSCWFPFFFGGGGEEEISAPKANLGVIAAKVDDLAQTTEEFQAYSYGFNVKILVYRNVWAKSLLYKLVICVAIFN